MQAPDLVKRKTHPAKRLNRKRLGRMKHPKRHLQLSSIKAETQVPEKQNKFKEFIVKYELLDMLKVILKITVGIAPFSFLMGMLRGGEIFSNLKSSVGDPNIAYVIIICIIVVPAFLCIFTIIHLIAPNLAKPNVFWSLVTGIITSYIGFSLATMTQQHIKDLDNKKLVTSLVNVYLDKYDDATRDIDYVIAMHTIADKENGGWYNPHLGDDNSLRTEEEKKEEKIMQVDREEGFATYMTQNVDLLAKTSPILRNEIFRWSNLNADFYFPYRNSLEDHNEGWQLAMYLVGLATWEAELNHRRYVLYCEGKYQNGEISEETYRKDVLISEKITSYFRLKLKPIREVAEVKKVREEILEERIGDKLRKKYEKEVEKELREGSL